MFKERTKRVNLTFKTKGDQGFHSFRWSKQGSRRSKGRVTPSHRLLVVVADLLLAGCHPLQHLVSSDCVTEKGVEVQRYLPTVLRKETSLVLTVVTIRKPLRVWREHVDRQNYGGRLKCSQSPTVKRCYWVCKIDVY